MHFYTTKFAQNFNLRDLNSYLMDHPPIVLFDVDGVLLASKGHQLRALELFHEKRFKWDYEKRKSVSSMEILRRFEAADSEHTWESAKKLNANFRDILPHRVRRWIFIEKMGSKVRTYEQKYSDFFPNVVDAIRTLHQQGILMGICSNGEGKRITGWLERKGLENIICCFTSRDTRKRYGIKPSPKPLYALLLMIKKRYNLGKIDLKKVAFIGDNRTDILSAQNAKMKAVAVLNGHGYAKELEEMKPDLILQSAAEISQNITKIFP